MKKFLVLFIALHYNLVLGQSNSTDETWAINKNSSEILYLGKHFLHDWSGKNNNYFIGCTKFYKGCKWAKSIWSLE